MILFVLIVCIVFFGVNVYYFRRNRRVTQIMKDFKKLHKLTDGVTDFEDLVYGLTRFFEGEKGFNVDFYKKDRSKNVLRGRHSEGEIALLQKNSPAVQAFISLKSCDLRDSDRSDSARRQSSQKTWFVPLAMNKTAHCWAWRGCNNNSCACFKKDIPHCWTHSGKSLSEMFVRQEGRVRCISCACFLPVGVFRVSGEDLSDVHTLITSCAENVRSAVTCYRAGHAKTRDPLTGLPNRQGFFDHLDVQQRIAAQFNLPLSIGMFALDPMIYPSYHCEFGNDGLRLLEASLERSAILARFSEHIFSIIFVGTRKDDAFRILEGIRRYRLSANNRTHDGRRSTLSAGVAGFPEDMVKDEAVALYVKALSALEEAKTIRNRVVSYTP